MHELENWLSDGPEPTVFPYSTVLTEYHRVGKHFVGRELLSSLDRIRATLPAPVDAPAAARRLRQFLDVALDKWDDRYDYRSYLALSLLGLAGEGNPGAGATDDPTDRRQRRDRLLLRLVADLLAFELAAEAGATRLLPQQRPAPALVVKRCRLGLRVALPALRRLGLADAVRPDDGVVEAARLLHRLVTGDESETERQELRLSLLPVYLVHDEYLFIRVLQAYEGTFALLVEELREAVTLLSFGGSRTAAERLAFAEELLTGSAHLFSLLATMQPESFRTFRVYTEGASAIQSRNYKLVEALCRTPDQDRLESAAFLSVAEVRAQVLAGQESLEGMYRAADLGGLLDPTDRGLLDERMRGFAAALTQWRHTHYRLATRMLGERTGTGYTQGTPYLDAARRVPVFTVLDPAP